MGYATATAFAPATVGNVAVGFDILGHAFGVIGDRVRADRAAEPGVRMRGVTGHRRRPAAGGGAQHGRQGGAVAGRSPHRRSSASSSRSRRAFRSLGPRRIGGLGRRGGGRRQRSCSDGPLAAIELLPHAIAGEAVASGSRHADNIAPALFGGLVLTVGIDNPRIKRIPVPPARALRAACTRACSCRRSRRAAS